MSSHSGYPERARFYDAEISQVPEPVLLAGLLRPGLAVAEMPSGTGHFLPAYQAAAADVTLVDACPQMLAAAQAQAAHTGNTITTVCALIEDLPGRAGPFGLIVMPNGALNQLAATAPPTAMLAAATRLLLPEGLILIQVLNPNVPCGFYDPGLPYGRWLEDRQFQIPGGRTVTRRRRQHHHHDVVFIDFEMSCDDQTIHRQQVTLRLLVDEDVQAALGNAGLRIVKTVPSVGGLTEFLCSRLYAEER